MSVSTSCRMCLSQCDNGELNSMLTVPNDSINLWTMYDYIMNVGEYVDETFVPYICSKCKGDLKIAYNFKLMCSETERTLNELVQSDDNKSESEVKIEECDNESEIEYLYFDECIEYDGDEGAEFPLDNSEAVNVESPIAEVDCDADPDIEEVDNDVMKPRKCRLCNIEFHSIKEYRFHYKDLHGRVYRKRINNDYTKGRKCIPCNIQFPFLKEYQMHYRRVHVRKMPSDTDPLSKVLCPQCGNLIGKKSIGKHMKKHLGVRESHACTTCGKTYASMASLITHKRVHTNDKRWECKICGEKFLHWTSRRNHIRSKHSFEKNYECHLCGKKFSYSSNLYNHIRRHKNELPHRCALCPKGFTTKTELQNHQVVHTKDKNEICEICQKHFGTRKNLQAHRKIHSGERNYVCWVCDKRFTQPHVLRTHLKTHPGVQLPERGAILTQKVLSRIGSNVAG